jgi:hypothetical protein
MHFIDQIIIMSLQIASRIQSGAVERHTQLTKDSLPGEQMSSDIYYTIDMVKLARNKVSRHQLNILNHRTTQGTINLS